MHEMALAVDVVDAVTSAAKEAGAKRVTAIYLTIGHARDVVEDLFDGLLAHLCKGTVAEGADVVMNNPPLTVCCQNCGTVYPVSLFDTEDCPDCPVCGGHDRRLNSGMEFRIDKIEVV